MIRQRHEPAWPFLGVLACLFALAVIWPRAWEQAAQLAPESKRRPLAVAPPNASRRSHAPSIPRDEVVQLAPIPQLLQTPLAEGRPPMELSPRLTDAVQRVTELLAVEPAGKLAGPPVEVDLAGPHAAEVVLPARRSPPEGPVSPAPRLSASTSQEQPEAKPEPIVQGPATSGAAVPGLAGPHEPGPAGEADAPGGGFPAIDVLAEQEVSTRKRSPVPTKRAWEEGWPEPVSLVDRLDGLSDDCEIGLWAIQVAGQLRKFGSLERHAPKDARLAVLRRLYQLAREAGRLDTGGDDSQLAVDLRGTRHALARRLGLWVLVVKVGGPSTPVVDATGLGPRRLSSSLAELLRHVEQYERTGSPRDARQVSQDCLLLTSAQEPELRELGRWVEAYYRNANLRLVLTQELLDRMMPEQEPEWERVDEQVMGKPVRGRSVTHTDVGIRMIPDPGRARVALAIEGRVSSLTSSASGPARFYNNSQSTYVALKEVELDAAGLHVKPAEIAVDNSIRLRGLQTSLDMVPLVGTVVQEIAHSQHRHNRPQMNREVEQKVAARARKQIDEEADARLGELDARLRLYVLAPLGRLSLGPQLVGAETTRHRLTMWLRTAADDQLAGSTLRPWAPSDSLASCQIHESVLNNLIQRLEFDGGTFTLAEIRRRVAHTFNRPQMLDEDQGRDDVTVTFADEDAVRIRCRDGQVAVMLSIARLAKRPHRWTDFEVYAYYRPVVHGRSAELVRDGVVELIGRRSLRSQIPLRGIFSKTFSKKHSWRLIPDRIVSHPGMEGLCVTQFMIDDGWIGLAIGPERKGLPSNVALSEARGGLTGGPKR